MGIIITPYDHPPTQVVPNSGSWIIWVQIQALSFTSYVTLGKLLSLSLPPCLLSVKGVTVAAISSMTKMTHAKLCREKSEWWLPLVRR